MYSAAIESLVQWADRAPAPINGQGARIHFNDVVNEEFWFSAVSTSLLPGAIEQLSFTHDDPVLSQSDGWSEWYASRPDVSANDLEGVKSYFRPDPASFDDTLGPDCGSRTQIIEDANIFPGGDPRRFVDDYAKTLPLGWRDSIVIFVLPGQPVVVVRWTADREYIANTRAWADRQPDRRWRALPSFHLRERGDYQRVAIPSLVAAPKTRAELAAKIDTEHAAHVVPLPIAALNAVLRSGGIPRDARVILQGPPESGKTAIALELAAGLAADATIAPNGVAWVATADEPATSICRRLVQREGGDMRTVFCGENLMVIDGELNDLEAILGAGFSFVFVDSLQHVRTRAGANASKFEAVAAAVEAIAGARVPVFATSHVVRGAAKREQIAAAWGGSGIEHMATLVLNLRATDEGVTVTVAKSRHGGRGSKIDLVLDEECQRVLSPDDDALDPLWLAIQAALTSGPCSRADVVAHVKKKRTDVLAAIRARVASGHLVDVDGQLSLATVPKRGTG